MAEQRDRGRGASGEATQFLPVKPSKDPAQRERQLAALRATLELERLSRQKLEALSEEAAGNLARSEALLGTLSCELEEVSSQQESIERQLQEKDEKHCDLLRKVRREQEHRAELEDQLAKSAVLRRDLQSRVRRDQEEKLSADQVVKDLQLKLQQFEKDVLAAVGGKGRTAEAMPAGLEAQLQQLRIQLEDTVKVVQGRYVSGVGDVEEVKPGASSSSIGAMTSELSHHLSAGEELLPLSENISKESELPTDERLIGQWGVPLKEEMLEAFRPGMSRTAQATSVQPAAAAGLSPRASSAPSLSGLSTGSGGVAQTSPRSPSAAPLRLPEDCGQDVHEAPALCLPSPCRRSGNVLSVRDLSEIKTLKKPPPPIRMLMEICCLLFHIKPEKQMDSISAKRCVDYWEPARRYLLSDPFFPAKLRAYEASKISTSQCARIRRYFQDPEFSAERVRNCSKAAFELYDWVRCLVDEPAQTVSAKTAGGEDATHSSAKVYRQHSDNLTETRRSAAAEIRSEPVYGARLEALVPADRKSVV